MTVVVNCHTEEEGTTADDVLVHAAQGAAEAGPDAGVQNHRLACPDLWNYLSLHFAPDVLKAQYLLAAKYIAIF